MSTIQDCGYELLQHPPYSPDLAPSDYHLFPRMKTYLARQHFDSDDKVIEAVGEFPPNTQHSDFFFNGITALQHRWEKCVTFNGDYVEK